MILTDVEAFNRQFVRTQSSDKSVGKETISVDGSSVVSDKVDILVDRTHLFQKPTSLDVRQLVKYRRAEMKHFWTFFKEI